MLDKKDAQWWILEAQKHPDSAIDLIRLLADRLAFLDKQNENLRGEVVALKRRLRGEAPDADVEALQRRVHELEAALRRGNHERQVLAYAHDCIAINQPLGAAQAATHPLPGTARLLLSAPAANLLIITAESRAFTVTLGDLPIPENGSGPVPLGNPRDVAAILDQSVFEHCRFLVLCTQSGYVYTLLAGTINGIAARQEKLIRNLIPGDPIVEAVPSYNTELFAISRQGRWTRFPERAIAGSGSLVMNLPKKDRLVGIISLPGGDAELFFLTDDGRLFARDTADFAPRKAPGSPAGVAFKGHTILGVTTGPDLVVLTQSGTVLPVSLQKLRSAARLEGGTALRGLPEGESILAFAAL